MSSIFVTVLICLPSTLCIRRLCYSRTQRYNHIWTNTQLLYTSIVSTLAEQYLHVRCTVHRIVVAFPTQSSMNPKNKIMLFCLRNVTYWLNVVPSNSLSHSFYFALFKGLIAKQYPTNTLIHQLPFMEY